MKALTLLLVAGVTVSDAQEPRRHCRDAQWPKRLPALDAVVDSAALFDLIDTSESDTTSVVVSVLYKEDGTAAVRVVEPAGAPTPLGTFLSLMLSRGLRRITPLPSPMGALRVRLRAGPQRAGRVERSVYCPPEVDPDAPSGRQVIRVVQLPGERMPAGGRIRLDLQVFIDETGLVSDIRTNSGSGLRELDEAVVTDIRSRRYLPATIDGFPVPSWTKSSGSTMRL